MKILGIETSCDETAASLVEDGTKIISNVVASSQELHIKTGGIIPEIAAREQLKCILPVIKEAINQASSGLAFSNKGGGKLNARRYQLNAKFIDAIAVTIGPGLIGSLLVGVETAKTLAYVWQKPIIPVNHALAHIYANWLNPKPYPLNLMPSFPALTLIASGGHTELLLMKGHGKFKRLGQTRDDAAGECFDKVARLLGLGYPGGPAIAAEAAKYQISLRPEFRARANIKYQIKLPRPMINTSDFDFSFSGLKTAVLREIKKLTAHNLQLTQDLRTIPGIERKKFRELTLAKRECVSPVTDFLAHEVQEAITDVLVEKTIRAATIYKVKTILLAGGVAANQRLREKMKLEIGPPAGGWKLEIKLFAPPKNLCTDNAAMIASAAFFNFRPLPWQKITSHPDLEV